MPTDEVHEEAFQMAMILNREGQLIQSPDIYLMATGRICEVANIVSFDKGIKHRIEKYFTDLTYVDVFKWIEDNIVG